MRRIWASLLLGLAAPASAQELIVVTGNALPEPAGADAFAAQLIGRERFERSASGQLENILADSPSFQMFRRIDARTANPTSQGVTLRGIGGNAASRAVVLLDGVPVADPFAGWIPFPAIRPESIAMARIETGGSAGAFGAGALTGRIELSSAGPDVRGSDLSIDYGSRDSLQLGGALVERLGSGFVTLDADYARGDGYFLLREDDRGAVDIPADYEQAAATLRAVFPLGERTEFQLRGALFADDRTRGQRLVTSANEGADASIRLVGRGAFEWEALAYVQSRGYSASFARTADDRSGEVPALDQYNVPSTGLGAKLEVRRAIGDHQLRLGADWQHASGVTRERANFDGTRLTLLREAGGTSDIVGIFAGDSWTPTERLTLTAAGRLDRWWLTEGHFSERSTVGPQAVSTAFPVRDGWEPTARAGLRFAATPALALRGAAYLGWRLPTLNELYRPFRVGADATVANAALEPERSRGVEIGADFQPLSTARASLTLFANEAENAIANVTLAEGPGTFPGAGFVFGAYRQRLNLDSIEAKGVEANAELDIGRFTLGAAYAFTDSEVEGSGLTAAQDGFRPPQVPRHRANIRADYSHPAGAGGGLTLRYLGSQFEDDLEERALDDAFILDATAEMPLVHGIHLRLAAENLLDADIEAGIDADGIIDYGQPRTLWIGLGWRG